MLVVDGCVSTPQVVRFILSPFDLPPAACRTSSIDPRGCDHVHAGYLAEAGKGRQGLKLDAGFRSQFDEGNVAGLPGA